MNSRPSSPRPGAAARPLLPALFPALLLALLLSFAGCGRFLQDLASSLVPDIILIDDKTALENQVLGAYEKIDREMTLVGSARAVSAEEIRLRRAPPSGTAGLAGEEGGKARRRVLRAFLNQEYNRDDVERYKADGIFGEDNRGYVAVMKEAAEKLSAETLRKAGELAKEENADRRIVVERVIALNPNLGPSDLPKVEKIFARLYRDNAAPGDLVQDEDGEWVEKE